MNDKGTDGDAGKAERHKALRRGARAETFAAIALRLKGWRIAERNFRCSQGEIDIIARKGDLIAFVEVKARASRTEAIDAVGFETRRRIAAAASVWISRQRDADRLSWRFDIVAVTPGRWPSHHQDAF
jgi:putative endonuclease